MAETQIAAWQPVITKGAVFEPLLTFSDANNVPDAVSSATVFVSPNGAAPISWTQGNGLFVNVSTGVFQILLDEAYTAALTWTSGLYRVEIVDSDGNTIPCVIESTIFAEDCII